MVYYDSELSSPCNQTCMDDEATKKVLRRKRETCSQPSRVKLSSSAVQVRKSIPGPYMKVYSGIATSGTLKSRNITPLPLRHAGLSCTSSDAPNAHAPT